MSTWWFVRHAESRANAEGWLAGHHDVDLTPRGVAQARALAGALEALRPDRRWSSDLRRAWRTAELAWPRETPPLEQHRALRERHLGAWEQRGRSDLPLGAQNRLLTWDGTPPEGESQRMLARRVIGWLAQQDPEPSTLLFVHGGLIRTVVGLLDGTPTDRIGTWRVRNGEVVEREVAPGRWAELLAAIGPR